MGARLDPAERDRRAAERHKATFSGANYCTYDVEKLGHGSYNEWAAQAAAFINGNFFEIDVDVTNPAKPETVKPKKKNSNPLLDILGMDAMPASEKELTGFYRRAVMSAFSAAGSSDTAPEYVSQFMRITQAYERLKIQRGW